MTNKNFPVTYQTLTEAFWPFRFKKSNDEYKCQKIGKMAKKIKNMLKFEMNGGQIGGQHWVGGNCAVGGGQ